MAQWHLDELRTALERRGWRLGSELPGDDVRISGSWELVRSGAPSQIVIDFDGLDESRLLPMAESYACTVRGTTHSLYFRRRGEGGSVQRERWKDELRQFVEGVEKGHAG
jgi:hypothetical protein